MIIRVGFSLFSLSYFPFARPFDGSTHYRSHSAEYIETFIAGDDDDEQVCVYVCLCENV